MVNTSITGTFFLCLSERHRPASPWWACLAVVGLPRRGGPASPWWACLAVAGLPASCAKKIRLVA